MKLRFKHQKFQADAAKAVCDVFEGQPYLTQSYMMDPGNKRTLIDKDLYTGWRNEKLIPEFNDKIILENLNKVQRSNNLKPSNSLEGHYNLTVEMETGVGKTYAYIKTMYELNKKYGWSKFIVVVPSVAIREGVYKSFQITQEHFTEEYSKKIRYFIYNSARLTEIDRFANDNAINVMIINSQAFNAKGKDARRIYMKLDEFRSRRPIDIIASTNPILIIDEPQSVEGAATKERLKEFKPFITLRYSATHKDPYNMIYRLDAVEAYNKKLVKKISVKGITVTGNTATKGYLYLQSVNLSNKKAPTATIEYDIKTNKKIGKTTRVVTPGYNIYENSGGLDEYKKGYVVSTIDGRDNSITFLNGIKIYSGDVVGTVDEDQLRRIQIRETILSHIEREKSLFYKGIKVLSLFFIDEVAKYKQYNEAGTSFNGIYADIFEEEYNAILNNMQLQFGSEEYMKYLNSVKAEKTHQGYFSIDKKRNQFIDSKLGDRKERTSDDADAYDLIMKDKERLLDKKEPVRFIFSHSALREGWDNPNVFQICTLKQSNSEIRKRQEVGRGLRLCVNQEGERMDAGFLGEDVHNINVLTVIANESYDSFATALQKELAEAAADRPSIINTELFKNKVIKDINGLEQVIDNDLAQVIYEGLITDGYIKKGILTDKYYEDKNNQNVKIAEEVNNYKDSIIEILDSIYDSKSMQPDNARKNNVELKVDESKLAMPEFKKLWEKINSKSVYVVDFDTDELIKKSINALNKQLHVNKIFIEIVKGGLSDIKSKEDLQNAAAFKKTDSKLYEMKELSNGNIKYDLIGKIVEQTGLTRIAVVNILKGIEKVVFDQFKINPEDFIIKASNIINEQKATVIIEHITYNKINEVFDTSIFTEPTLKGQLGLNAVETNKNLYNYVITDSNIEKDFAKNLDASTEVAVYVKLPSGFFINTPVGKYNPDWAIAFNEGKIKHIYFVAETKGDMSTLQLKDIEIAKIHCAKEHFNKISGDNIVYEVVDNYESLLNIVMK